MQLLKDKVVFLTGGTEGIGYECAKIYHKAGVKVSIITHKEHSLQQCRMQFFNDEVHYILADVSILADIERTFYVDQSSTFAEITGIAICNKSLFRENRLSGDVGRTG